VWRDDKPINIGDYEKHWRDKTRGLYLCGIGRWFRVCRQNTTKDHEGAAKLIQILMMIAFSICAMAMGFLLVDR